MTGMGGLASSAAREMDSIYRRQRFIYDLTRRYYLLGRDRLIGELEVPHGGSVLEIGCGTARNLIKAARRYPDARFYGVDVSEEMLRTARGSVARAGLEARITLAAGDATAFNAANLSGTAAFDRVFISYALSMIPPWREVVRNAAACVAANGRLHIVDFGDFASYPGWVQHMQRAWLRRFSVTPIPQLEAELAAMANELGFTAAHKRLYGGYAVLACLRPRTSAV
jgi:S-adenosylmethionine-diacylgycerolhomoserine-N-methlytransferase